MEVIRKAQELAKAIQESEELLKVRELEVQLLNQENSDEKSKIYQDYTAAVQQFNDLLNAIRYILTSSYDGNLNLQRGCSGCCKTK